MLTKYLARVFTVKFASAFEASDEYVTWGHLFSTACHGREYSWKANALLDSMRPSDPACQPATCAEYVEVEPGVFMVEVEATAGAAAGAPSVAFSTL